MGNMTRRQSVYYGVGFILVWGISGLVVGCDRDRPSPDLLTAPSTMTLSSPAVERDGAIAPDYTCDGANRSPALQWGDPPTGTQSFVLVLDDPDAPGGTFTHWVLYDLPADTRQLPAGLPADPLLSEGGVQAKNDFGRYGYGGPCPPNGTHRYRFRLYALNTLLDLPPGSTLPEVITAAQGHELAQAELVGRYSRP